LTTLLEPSEITSPINTLAPLNASESLPGKYGYATTMPPSQNMVATIRRVGCAIS
jgi:hypothetical protein